MSQVTGAMYETLKQVTEMLEKGSKTRFFVSAHVQLASDAAARGVPTDCQF
jgi:thiamine monophosphate synthase